MTGDLHGGDGVRSQGDGALYDIVDMALFQQVAGVLVVGAEHAPVSIFVTQQGNQGVQVSGGGAFPDHDELAPLQLGQGVLEVVTLVVGVYPGGDIGVEIIAAEVRGVAVNLLVVGLGRHNFLHRLVVSGDNSHKIHHLRQALDPGMIVEGVQTAVVQHRAGLIQGGGRDAGGQHKPHVHRQVFRGLEHILDAVGSHDVGDLMGIGDHGGGAVGENRLHKLPGGDQGTLQMDMGIQEAGEDDLSGAVHLRRAGVLSHANDESLRHGDVGGTELVGEYVDIGGVFQHQVRSFPSGGSFDDAALFQQFPVDLTRVTLRHGITPLIKFIEYRP